MLKRAQYTREVLMRQYRTLDECQPPFDQWRVVYNCERPHEGIGLAVPASRYQATSRPFPEILPPIEYPSTDIVRKVQESGQIMYQNRKIFVGHGFRGLHVALRSTTTDGVFDVFFCHQRIAKLDLKDPSLEQ